MNTVYVDITEWGERLMNTWDALEESVKLQSHYARLLNDYDGGTRKIFANATEWIDRLEELEGSNDAK